jgi:hypothetical protein
MVPLYSYLIGSLYYYEPAALMGGESAGAYSLRCLVKARVPKNPRTPSHRKIRGKKSQLNCQPKSDNPRAVEISSERTEKTGERLYSLYDTNALEKSDHV